MEMTNSLIIPALNLFVLEYIPEDMPGYDVKEDGPSFATWCVGAAKDGVIYCGFQASVSNLLPTQNENEFSEEVLVVNLPECTLQSKSSVNNMSDYFFDLEIGQHPRENNKLLFVKRADLPADIQELIIKAQKIYQNNR